LKRLQLFRHAWVSLEARPAARGSDKGIEPSAAAVFPLYPQREAQTPKPPIFTLWERFSPVNNSRKVISKTAFLVPGALV